MMKLKDGKERKVIDENCVCKIKSFIRLANSITIL